jgi:hypothetical protein
MPADAVGELAVEVAKVAGEAAGDTIHRRFGWIGCVISLLLVAAIIAALVYLL